MSKNYFLTVANNVQDTLISHLYDYPIANRSDVLALILQQIIGGMIMYFDAGEGAADGQSNHYFNRAWSWSEGSEISYDIDIGMHTLDDVYTQVQVTEAGELWEVATIATVKDVETEAYMLAKMVAIRANMETVVQHLRGIIEVEGRQGDGRDSSGDLSVSEGGGIQGDGVGVVGDAEDEVPGVPTGGGPGELIDELSESEEEYEDES